MWAIFAWISAHPARQEGNCIVWKQPCKANYRFQFYLLWQRFTIDTETVHNGITKCIYYKHCVGIIVTIYRYKTFHPFMGLFPQNSYQVIDQCCRVYNHFWVGCVLLKLHVGNVFFLYDTCTEYNTTSCRNSIRLFNVSKIQ